MADDHNKKIGAYWYTHTYYIIINNNLHDDGNVVLLKWKLIPASISPGNCRDKPGSAWNKNHQREVVEKCGKFGMSTEKKQKKNQNWTRQTCFFRFKLFKIREFGGKIYWMFPESHLNVHGTIIYKWVIQLTKMLAKGRV